MGLTQIKGTVHGLSGETKEVEFLVDSGATYTVLPEAVWRPLGLSPKRPIRLILADGTGIDRQLSQADITLPQGTWTSPVILGEAGDQPLLGVVTLEVMGYVLNPLTRELQPMQVMMA